MTWTPSALALVAANLLPLYLVIAGQWTLGQVILLFWLENVIIGVLNIIKMLTNVHGGIGAIPLRLFMSVFFTVHYGGFTVGHGFIVLTLFLQQDLPGRVELDTETLAFMTEQLELLFWPGVVLFVSHLISLITNYYAGGEYRRTSIGELMSKPYGRVVILHVTIIIGGMIAMALGQPLPALILLIVLKTVVDLAAHRREHREQPDVDG